MRKNTIISIASCLITTVICWFVAPAKRKNILKRLPLSVIFATLWGYLIDLRMESNETNRLVNDVIKNNIKTAPHFKLDELDDENVYMVPDEEDEDFREI